MADDITHRILADDILEKSDKPWSEGDLHAAVTGIVVQLLRERRGLTQIHVGKLAKIGQGRLSRIESGRSDERPGRTSNFDIMNLAVALGIKEAALLDLIRDARARAERAATASTDCGKAPWWQVVLVTTGSRGLRGLLTYAAAAALHPWPEGS